jgi:hypothetical protein
MSHTTLVTQLTIRVTESSHFFDLTVDCLLLPWDTAAGKKSSPRGDKRNTFLIISTFINASVPFIPVICVPHGIKLASLFSLRYCVKQRSLYSVEDCMKTKIYGPRLEILYYLYPRFKLCKI